MTRVLAVSDAVSPFIYSERFPHNLPPFDVVVSAGDMPGHILEFMATKLKVPPVYVLGNHGNALMTPDSPGAKPHLPGGCINAHRRVVEVGGLLIAGVEGSARYRPGDYQYSELEMACHCHSLLPRLSYEKYVRGRGVDIFLTHAPPRGPHEGEDHAHRGIPAFNAFVERWRPRVHVHGHVHLTGSNSPREYETESGVRVINAYEFTLIEL